LRKVGFALDIGADAAAGGAPLKSVVTLPPAPKLVSKVPLGPGGGAEMHVTATFVTFALPIVPVPLATLQV
jgi:hypothetical protein